MEKGWRNEKEREKGVKVEGGRVKPSRPTKSTPHPGRMQASSVGQRRGEVQRRGAEGDARGGGGGGDEG
jgi:hypothetical protein